MFWGTFNFQLSTVRAEQIGNSGSIETRDRDALIGPEKFAGRFTRAFSLGYQMAGLQP
jgi:hypothetical protein